MKQVKEKLEKQKEGKSEEDAKKIAEEVTAFEKGAAAFAKKIVASFKDYEFVSLFNSRNQAIFKTLFSTPASP